jgi:C-terminal processing protease CtpA/Prc
MSPPLRLVRVLAAACIGCLLVAAAAQALEKNSAYLAALESITAEDLTRHVTALAGEDFQGREAGTRGGRAAGDYLAQQFARLQLPGGGPDGSYFQPFPPNFRNVLAMVVGSDPEARRQVVVVGAHYDHVGYGTSRNSRGSIGQIHPGADDNASGTAGLLELAEALSLLQRPPRRSILLICFDAEEKGLLGSQYWTSHPTLPLGRVVAMLNMDMIGRLRADRLAVMGWRSGAGWRRLVSEQNDAAALSLDFSWTLTDHADEWPFFARGIPVLMVHTGLHDEYHTPRDKAKLINGPGMSRVARLIFAVAYDLAERPDAPHIRRVAGRETEDRRRAMDGPPRLPERLGVAWHIDPTVTDGVRITRVTPDSPAAKAKIRPGDHILRLADREIRGDDDLIGAVRTAPSPAQVIVRRADQGEPEQLSIELAGEPLRLGIVWRVDDAEPGTIILTHVVPGSPAAQAGLRAGDRIDQVGGRDFADEAQFSALVDSFPDVLTLTVERDGRMRTIVVQVAATPVRRAA